jgi:hypothetical protein
MFYGSVTNYFRDQQNRAARALIARTLDRGFESRLRHGCLSSSVFVVLSCVGTGLPTECRRFILSEVILNGTGQQAQSVREKKHSRVLNTPALSEIRITVSWAVT